MRIVFFALLVSVEIISFGQKIKKKDIQFSTIKESKDAIDYLNKMRLNPEFASSEVGIHLNNNTSKTHLIFDMKLFNMSKKRVVEMIRNDKISHKTKFNNIKNYRKDENCSYSCYVSLNNEIREYILDEGVKSKGHRKSLLYRDYNKYIGYSGGFYKGKYFTCLLLK